MILLRPLTHNTTMMRRLMPTSLRPARRKPHRLAIESLEDRVTPANFTPGNVVIYRIGDGIATLTNTGNPVFLDEYTPNGTLFQSIALPTTASGANKQLIAHGTATAEGLLTRSTDGAYLMLTGYARDLGGTGSLQASASATVNRTIGRVGADGSIDTTTVLSDFADAGSPRSAVSINGTDLWIAGGTGGVRYTTLGSTTSVQLSTSPTTMRHLNIFGGQLYTSAQSGSFRIGPVGTGLPTTSGQTITNLPGFTTTSPYGFFFADLDAGVAGFDTLYVSDDGTGALSKFSLVGGNWTSNGSIGADTDDYRGLTATVSGTTVTLFATRKGGSAAAGGGEFVTLTDSTGYNGAFAGTPTLLATAGTNQAFRGIALTPVFNAAPVNTFHNHTTNEDVGITLAGTSIADADAGTANISVTLSVPTGTLHVFDNISGGVTPAQVTGNDTNSVIITAPLAAMNTTLLNGTNGGVAFFPAQDFNGTVTVTMTTNDLGNTGFGGPKIDTDNFTVTVFSVNDAPVNSAPSAQTINEDTPRVFSAANGNAISVADVDAGTNPVQVTLTATNGTVTLGGTTGLTVSGNGTGLVTATGTLADTNAGLAGLTFIPTANFFGAASLQVKSDDQGNSGSGGTLTDTDMIAITINSVNDAPVLNDATFQVNAGIPDGTAVGSVTATDIENNTITYAITAGNTGGAFAIDPATGQITVATSSAITGGPFALTVAATDNGTPNETDTATITVNVNTAPTISADIVDMAAFEDAPPIVIDLGPVFADAEDPDSSLTFSIFMLSNPSLFDSVDFAGTTLTLTLAPNAAGTCAVTVRATDPGGLSANEVFSLFVTAVNDAPTLDAIGNLVIGQDAGEQTVNLTGISAGAANESGQQVSIVAASDNPGLIPNPTVVYGGGTTGTLKFTPATGVSGTATITMTVTDDGGTANGGSNTLVETFTVTVNAQPTTSGIADQIVAEDAAEQTIDLGAAFADAEDPDPALTYTIVANSNPALFASLAIAGTSLKFTPQPDAFGESSVRVRATDTGGLFVEAEFLVTVVAVNDAPTLAPLTDRTVDEDASQQSVPLTGIGAGAANELGQVLTVSATSDNPAVVPNPIIEYTTGSSTGTLKFTPAPNATGSATITVMVADDGGGTNTVTRTFTVTVGSIADRPEIDTAPTPMLPAVPLKTAPTGAPVSDLVENVTDPDAGALSGIAVTAVDNTNGTWQFSLDGGATWTNIPAVSATSALLLAADLDTRVRFLPKARFTGFASLSFRAWDQSNGAVEGTQDDTTNPADIAYSTATERAWVAVGKTTPKVDADGHPLLTPVKEDSKASAAFPVKKFLGLLAKEVGATGPLGIALSAADEAGGKWQFNVGKGGWQDVGTVSDAGALLLRPTDRLRFLPNHDFDAQATIAYHTWDLTTGTPGTKTAVAGAVFSAATETAIADVLPINDAPVLDLSKAAVLNPVDAGQTTNESALGSQFAATDVEGAAIGVAIVKATGAGTWEFKPAGGSWTPLPLVSMGKALLLDADAEVRFTAAATAIPGTAALSFRAWDHSAGTAGQQVPVRGTAFSKTTEILTVAVENTAPSLNTSGSPVLTNVKAGAKPGAGDAVSRLLGTSPITDADPKALKGITITFADNANGKWQYSLGGNKWVDVGTVTKDSAVLLTDVNRLRFVPNAGFTGQATIQYVAWDRTTGQAGDRIDTDSGLNSFSLEVETATVTVVA